MLPAILLAIPLIAQVQNQGVQVTQEGEHIAVQIDGKDASTFYFGPDVTKPYLWPLRTASGIELTRHWPMETNNKDPRDHIHHRGLWLAHSLVNGIDFWNSDPSYHKDNMGHQVVTGIEQAQGGADSGTIKAVIDWRGPTGKVLITEKRAFVFQKGDPRIIDLDSVLTARQDVTFGDEKDGVLGIRLAPELNQMTSSEGCHQEAGCWGKRADWVDVSGPLAGVTVFEHPDNPRYPTYWHVRDYGLLAANIFGVKFFTNNSTADGSMKLQTGQKLHFRYRVILHSGDAASAKVQDLYRAWTLR
jgi:hypothetical protein